MASEIVKYENTLNAVALRHFKSVNLDVFFAVVQRMRDKGSDTVTLTFSEIRSLAQLDRHLTGAELEREIARTYELLLHCRAKFALDDGSYGQFLLFSDFTVHPSTLTVTIAANPKYSYLLNDLTSHFTRFELGEYTGLKSTYAKECYRRCKQYRQTGEWSVGFDEFCELMDVPDNSRNPNYVNTRVLKSIARELGPLIGLSIDRQYARQPGQKGRPRLSGYIFRFDRELTPLQAARFGQEAARAQERRLPVQRDDDAPRGTAGTEPDPEEPAPSPEDQARERMMRFRAEHEGRSPREEAEYRAANPEQ